MPTIKTRHVVKASVFSNAFKSMKLLFEVNFGTKMKRNQTEL